MHPLVRFWLMLGGLLVSLVSLGYLFFSFISPGAKLVATAPEARIVATLVAVVAASLFVWTALIVPERDRNVPEPQK
jgi:hypothetical protein